MNPARTATRGSEGSPSARTIRRSLALVTALVALLAMTPLSASPVSAQTPTPPPLQVMTIEVPDPQQPDLLPGSSNQDLFGERYAAFADSVLCVAGDVPADGGAFSIVLGEEGQPEECRILTAILEVAGLAVGPMAITQESDMFRTRVVPGRTLTLSNWAPYPTDTAFPFHVCSWLESEGADLAGCGITPAPTAATMVISMPGPGVVGSPNFDNFDWFRDVFAVFADGDLCVRAVPPEDGSAFAVVLGEPGQPEGCRAAGGLVEFAVVRDGSGDAGSFFTRLMPGREVTFDYNAPIADRAFLPAYMCRFFVAEGVDVTCPEGPSPTTTDGPGVGSGTGGGGVTPAGTGNAGLPDNDNLRTVAIATAATLLLVLIVRRQTAEAEAPYARVNDRGSR